MASLDATRGLATRRGFEAQSPRAILRSWRAELAPFPHRWRRAARVAFVTALGAGVMATLQITNPLGLTLLLSLAAPEYAFSLATGITFLVGAAAMQLLMLETIGALVNLPVAHVSVFIAYTFITTYLIYGVPRFGRLWIWVQIPTVTAFYLVLFDHRGLGWDNAQMFASLVVAVAMLWLFNNVIWPAPAATVLIDSINNTLERSRRRLALLIKIFLAEDGAIPDHDRGVASKLGYHLTLLAPAARDTTDIREPAMLLAKTIAAERIHNGIDRLCVPACTQLGAALDDSWKTRLHRAAGELDARIESYIAGGSLTDVPFAELDALSASPSIETAEIARHFDQIASLLIEKPDQLPRAAAPHRLPTPAAHLNKFLIRFCTRHTIAMTIAFVAGLFDNNAAIHAALWLLMIGGPPSHGATAKKFTVRAIGSAGALALTALATITLAPNFVSLPPYMLAIFAGALLMTYIGEGGGQLSYLAIGGTAFVIAFSAPGPRPDMVGSIWTIWGISFGMIIRALVSVEWREHTNRTLAEEFERPIAALVTLASSEARADAHRIEAAEITTVAGIQEILSVVADAQLEGPSTGIDARDLVDALDTMRRFTFALGNLALEDPDETAFDVALRGQLGAWLENLRLQLEPGHMQDAPLRTMVVSASHRELTATNDPRRAETAQLILTLADQLKTIRLR